MSTGSLLLSMPSVALFDFVTDMIERAKQVGYFN